MQTELLITRVDGKQTALELSPAQIELLCDCIQIGLEGAEQNADNDADILEAVDSARMEILEFADEADADAIAEARGFEMGKKARRLDESLGLAEPFASEAREALHNAGCSG